MTSRYAEVKVGDVGTSFQVHFEDRGEPVDTTLLTGASVTIRVASAGKSFDRAAQPVPPERGGAGDGSDGRYEFLSIAGDIDAAGEWQYEGFLTANEGSWTSDPISFDVTDRLPAP